jgi:phosphoglycolate phosphatase-like HAD superfamily hydrolase
MKKLILFDIDGTLLLTGGAGKLAFDRAFAQLYGIENAWRDIHPDGRTDYCLIRELFELNLNRRPRDTELQQVRSAYEAAMGPALVESTRFRLMPGVVELLALIEDRGLGVLGLATGNFEATAYQKLERANLRKYFNFGGFGSDHIDRLELTRRALERGRQALGRVVDPEEVLLIGDTVHDIRCGKLLGLVTVAVATGSTPAEELAAMRPDFLLEKLEPVEEVVAIFS